MRALAILATLAALCAGGCDDDPAPMRVPEGPGRYAVYSLDAEGFVRGFRCDGYAVGRGGALTAEVREVLAAGEDGRLRPGARVTWQRWVAVDLFTGEVRHRC